jgi:type IV pilus assembly protein PilE
VFVVVVILGILSAIAVPMYSRSVAKTRQADAKAQLVVIQQAQEMYKLQNNSYATQAQRTSLSGWNEMAGRYTFSITAATATTFTAQASGDVDGDGVNDVWTINQDGVLVNTVPDV